VRLLELLAEGYTALRSSRLSPSCLSFATYRINAFPSNGQTNKTNYFFYQEVVFVQAPDGYVANTYRSVGDIEAATGGLVSSQQQQTGSSGIILNMPVVPTNSMLQDPADKSRTAPINPVPVWYKGTEVWTYGT